MRYKFITFTFSLLFLTSPITAQELGILYLKKVNGKIGWFESGNAQKNWKYTGEIFEGKPNGNGVLISPFEEYSGEFKNGRMHGQLTHTYEYENLATRLNGKKRVGEFREGKPWNVKSYDKNGNIEIEWVNGKKLEKETEPHSFRLRFMYGSLSVETATSTNTSIAFIWNGWGLGQTNENYLDESAGEKKEFQTQYTELSYTFDLSELIYDSLTMTLGAGMPSGEAKITTTDTNTVHNSSTVSGYTLFSVFGIEFSYFEILAGFRLNNIKYSEFESSSAITLGGDYIAWGGQPMIGLGFSF